MVNFDHYLVYDAFLQNFKNIHSKTDKADSAKVLVYSCNNLRLKKIYFTKRKPIYFIVSLETLRYGSHAITVLNPTWLRLT